MVVRTIGNRSPSSNAKFIVPLSVTISVIMALFTSCHGKYELPDMESGELIDVSCYIKNGWRADSCNGRLSRIINPDPYQPCSADNQTLSYIAQDWQEQKKRSWEDSTFTFLAEQTQYVYSYIIYTEPVDVYVTTLTVNGISTKLYVRYSGNSFRGPYDEQGWVICTNKS